MSEHSEAAATATTQADLSKVIARYQQPSLRKAIWQLVNTFVPYIALWILMVRSVQLGMSYWITLALAVVAAGFLMRIFIMFHDCGHGSFFASRRANRILGTICGVLTFTPYEDWRHAHAIHHATVGNLDCRGTGDVWTMTVREYKAATPRQRLAYRLFRHPLVMFGLGPAYVFLLSNRLPHKESRKKDRLSVWVADLAIAAILVVAGLTIGLRTYVLVQLPIILLAATAGVWLFFVQHQFEGVYWARNEQWDVLRSALEGSSYYRLPKVLQWFSGNIGLHHIHHIRPRIPNYNLQQCYDETAALQEVQSLTLGASLRSLRLRLWDEERQELVSFRALKTARM